MGADGDVAGTAGILAHLGIAKVYSFLVYDRTEAVVRRHVAPGEAVPLHPEEVGFAGPYDFDVLAAYRPLGKGPVERQALLVRPHVLAGRAFSCVEERQLRHLGKDCLVAFDGNLYSVPARSAPAG